MIFLPKSYWQVKSTKNKGRGIFAKNKINKGTVIGDYTGRVVRTQDVDLNTEKENMYLMYYHDQASIYPDLTIPELHLVNHSCSPNCWVYSFHGHTLFFAIRDIKNGEELTIDYLLAPKSEFCNPCTHSCQCGSPNCRRTFHLDKDRFEKWRSFQNKHFGDDKKARIRYGKNLKPLSKYPDKIDDEYIKTLLLEVM